MQTQDSRANRADIFDSKQVVDHIKNLTVGNPNLLTIALSKVALMDLLECLSKVHALVRNLLGSDVLY